LVTSAALLNPSTFTCTGSGGTGSGNEEQRDEDNNNDGDKDKNLTAECDTPSTTCKDSVPGGTTDDLISIDKDYNYYEGINCKSKKKIGVLKAAKNYCIEKAKGNCDTISCYDATNDTSSLDEDIRTKTSAGKIQYFTFEDKNCGQPITDEEIVRICFPQADPDQAEKDATCNANILCKDLPGISGIINTTATASYKNVNNEYIFYETINCASTTKTNNIVSYCNNQPTPIPPDLFENVVNSDSRDFLCGTTVGLYQRKKYTDWSGLNIKGDLKGFINECIKSGLENGMDIQVVIGDGDVEGFVLNDYMNCCVK